jgi:apolipoprotein N-acyltransferase
MRDAANLEAPNRKSSFKPLALVVASLPTFAESSLAIASALFLVLSFPNFDLWWLAWIGMVPLLVVIARAPKTGRAFFLGWFWAIVFFYGSCWWLTYPMIHYGHLHAWLAYPLLLLPVVLVALFPAMACAGIARIASRFGPAAFFAAPLIWVSFEWLRYEVTGQLWNALGYSQAFHPLLIQTARWGGVYAVSFLLLTANVSVAFLWLRLRSGALARPSGRAHSVRRIGALPDGRASAPFSLGLPVLTLLLVVVVIGAAAWKRSLAQLPPRGVLLPVVAVQPNVPMDGSDDSAATTQLLDRHLELSKQGLRDLPGDVGSVVLVIWPESPMNFSYSRDPHLKEIVSGFARSYPRRQRGFLLVNSLETTPNGNEHNSALLINEEGGIVAQYDKIRLMPFGEYVPLPQWLPGASSVRGIVGEFTPGSSYTLMPLGAIRAGVFICIEAAHPGIARSFTNGGAEVLVNISNDGYLGPTPVMRQHLANAVFRAVENGRPLLRVTNTGISASISPTGEIRDATPPFEPTVRSWIVATGGSGKTFYTGHGDLFVYACALISLGILFASFVRNPTVREGAVS